MSLESLFIALIVVFVVGLFLYWQLIIAEGVYFGAPLVILLYDWTAERYNSLKEFEPRDEDMFVGQPIARRLASQPNALVLDAATGTGRVPLALLRQTGYVGHIIGVDRSAKMLAVAHRETPPGRVNYVRADMMALPFADHTFPMVTCLEALEFLPDPAHGLTELIRVLESPTPANLDGGWLLTTRRIGWETILMPGKTWTREEMLSVLQTLPVQFVTFELWQDIYELVWIQKARHEE